MIVALRMATHRYFELAQNAGSSHSRDSKSGALSKTSLDVKIPDLGSVQEDQHQCRHPRCSRQQ